MIFSIFQPVYPSPLDGRKWEHQIILTDTAVMNHAAKWCLVPGFLGLFAVTVDRPYDDIIRPVVPVAASLIREAQHFPRVWIELRMSRERRGENLAFEVIPPYCFKCAWIHDIRWPILLGREEDPAPEGDVCVRCGADHPLDGLIIRVWVAVAAEQGSPSGGLGFVSIRLNIALFEVCMAVGNSNGRHAAVAVLKWSGTSECSSCPNHNKGKQDRKVEECAYEMDVIFEDGREAVIGLDPVECAVDLGRDSAIEFKVENVPFETGRLVKSLEYAGRWVDDTVRGPDPAGIV